MPVLSTSPSAATAARKKQQPRRTRIRSAATSGLLLLKKKKRKRNSTHQQQEPVKSSGDSIGSRNPLLAVQADSITSDEVLESILGHAKQPGAADHHSTENKENSSNAGKTNAQSLKTATGLLSSIFHLRDASHAASAPEGTGAWRSSRRKAAHHTTATFSNTAQAAAAASTANGSCSNTVGAATSETGMLNLPASAAAVVAADRMLLMAKQRGERNLKMSEVKTAGSLTSSSSSLGSTGGMANAQDMALSEGMDLLLSELKMTFSGKKEPKKEAPQSSGPDDKDDSSSMMLTTPLKPSTNTNTDLLQGNKSPSDSTLAPAEITPGASRNDDSISSTMNLLLSELLQELPAKGQKTHSDSDLLLTTPMQPKQIARITSGIIAEPEQTAGPTIETAERTEPEDNDMLPLLQDELERAEHDLSRYLDDFLRDDEPPVTTGENSQIKDQSEHISFSDDHSTRVAPNTEAPHSPSLRSPPISDVHTSEGNEATAILATETVGEEDVSALLLRPPPSFTVDSQSNIDSSHEKDDDRDDNGSVESLQRDLRNAEQEMRMMEQRMMMEDLHDVSEVSNWSTNVLVDAAAVEEDAVDNGEDDTINAVAADETNDEGWSITATPPKSTAKKRKIAVDDDPQGLLLTPQRLALQQTAVSSQTRSIGGVHLSAEENKSWLPEFEESDVRQTASVIVPTKQTTSHLHPSNKTSTTTRKIKTLLSMVAATMVLGICGWNILSSLNASAGDTSAVSIVPSSPNWRENAAVMLLPPQLAPANKPSLIKPKRQTVGSTKNRSPVRRVDVEAKSQAGSSPSSVVLFSEALQQWSSWDKEPTGLPAESSAQPASPDESTEQEPVHHNGGTITTAVHEASSSLRQQQQKRDLNERKWCNDPSALVLCLYEKLKQQG